MWEDNKRTFSQKGLAVVICEPKSLQEAEKFVAEHIMVWKMRNHQCQVAGGDQTFPTVVLSFPAGHLRDYSDATSFSTDVQSSRQESGNETYQVLEGNHRVQAALQLCDGSPMHRQRNHLLALLARGCVTMDTHLPEPHLIAEAYDVD